MKREKYRAKNGCLPNISTNSKGTIFVILKNHKHAYQKEKIESNEQSKEGVWQSKFMKKSGMPDRVESGRKINCSKNRPKARLEFVKPIRNGLRKSLIKSKQPRAQTGLAGRENEIRLQKKTVDAIERCT